MRLSGGGEPNTVLGSMVVGGHVLPQSKGVLCTVIDPNGHRLDLPNHIYSVNKWGQISPIVHCQVCGWSENVTVEAPDE